MGWLRAVGDGGWKRCAVRPGLPTRRLGAVRADGRCGSDEASVLRAAHVLRLCETGFVRTATARREPRSCGRPMGFASAEVVPFEPPRLGWSLGPADGLWASPLRKSRHSNRRGSAGASPYQCNWYSVGYSNESHDLGRANLPVSRGGSDRLRWHTKPLLFHRCFLGRQSQVQWHPVETTRLKRLTQLIVASGMKKRLL